MSGSGLELPGLIQSGLAADPADHTLRALGLPRTTGGARPPGAEAPARHPPDTSAELRAAEGRLGRADSDPGVSSGELEREGKVSWP